ncbi:MAG TPA: hypothetical protein VMV20_07310 [Chitinophagaceae bacterium]|nr:hypothetical protein [Chitinophagaceae bacterium]
MRAQIIFLLIFLFPAAAWAQCPVSQWTVYPLEDRMDNHSMVLIFGQGKNTEVLDEVMHHRGSFFLQSGFMQVVLLPVQYHQGARNLSEILLKPEFFLQSGTTYELRFSGPSLEDSTALFRHWEVTPNDPHAPEPVLEGNVSLDHNGTRMVCRMRGRGMQPLLAQIVLIDPRFKSLHKQYKKFLLPLQEGTIGLTGGECAAAFQVEASIRYTAIVSLTDLDGHSSLPVEGLQAREDHP